MEALISHFLNISDPENLSDEKFGAKYQQADWLRRNPQARGVGLTRLIN